MAFDVNSLVIDHVRRGSLFNKSTGELIFTINQIKDANLECSGESVFTSDALGSKIASFDRSKDATLSGSNAVFDFGLLAAQLGANKKQASASAKIKVPMFEEVEVSDDGKLVLKKVPVGTTGAEVKYVYKVKKDRSCGEKFEVGTTAATQFSINAATKTITLPSEYSVTTGDTFYVWYDYEADGTEGNGAVQIDDAATEFAKSGRFDLEVIFCDICDQGTKYFGHIVFDSAKMDNGVTINFNNEAEHGFTINCVQDYCTADKKLFKMIIPE